MRNKKGFTLVEVLLVIALIAILAAIVIVAINPGRQISQANDTQRRSDVKTILDAVHEYSIDNRGALPAGIPQGAAGVELNIGSGAGEVNLCDIAGPPVVPILVPTYIAAMPFDPTDLAGGGDAQFTDCTNYDTGYSIREDANGRVVVSAPSAEITIPIEVTR